MNPLLNKNYTADGAVAKHKIVKYGTADGTGSVSSSSTDKFFGVSYEIDTADGDRLDVVENGIADVLYGGVVTKGDFLTSNANGNAVKAGSGDRVVGEAKVSGVSGDIGKIKVMLSNKDANVLNTYEADGAVAGNRIVKPSTAAGTIAQASAATDLLTGVSDADGAADEADCVVVETGIAPVEYGGTVTKGNFLTADANGKAITASTAERVIGTAMVSGVDGDVGSVKINPFFLTIA